MYVGNLRKSTVGAFLVGLASLVGCASGAETEGTPPISDREGSGGGGPIILDGLDCDHNGQNCQLTSPIIDVRIGGWTYNPELTPFVMGWDNGTVSLAMSSSDARECRSPSALLGTSAVIPHADCSSLSQRAITSHHDATGVAHSRTPQAVDAMSDAEAYALTYNGAQSWVVDRERSRRYVVRHIEHQSVTAHGGDFRSRFIPEYDTGYDQNGDLKCPTTGYAGMVDGNWRNCWTSFLSFVSVSSENVNMQTGEVLSRTDLGPVVWDPRGMLNDEGKPFGGTFYQPTLALGDEHLHVYAGLVGTENGLGYACQVNARAPLASADQPSQWQLANASGGWNASLPAGFSLDTIGNWLTQGTNAEPTCMFKDESSRRTHSVWFRVAKLRGMPGWVAIEDRIIPDPSCADDACWSWVQREFGLRYSEDLSNWTDFERIAAFDCEDSSNCWATGSFVYPTFLDRTGTSSQEIDPAEFFIMGKSHILHDENGHGEYHTRRMRMALDYSDAEMPQPSLSRGERLALHYFDETLQWRMPWQDEGVRWHANRLNTGTTCADAVTTFMESSGHLDSSSTDDEFLDVALSTLLLRKAEDVTARGWFAGRLEWLRSQHDIGTARRAILNEIASTDEATSACNTGCGWDNRCLPATADGPWPYLDSPEAPPPPPPPETQTALSRNERLVLHSYDQVLGWRMPWDDDGVQWHVQRLDDGLSCADDVTTFMEASGHLGAGVSDDDFLDVAIAAMLLRPADDVPDGRNWFAGRLSWLKQSQDSETARRAIVQEIGATDEAANACSTACGWDGRCLPETAEGEWPHF